MTTISEALAIAMAHHRAGRLAAAEQIYRRILERQPDQSDAWHLLGMVAQQKNAEAVLATLWDVNDASTSRLISDFYDRWVKNPAAGKAEALRQAQIAFLRGSSELRGSGNGRGFQAESGPTAIAHDVGYSHPFYWAPFVLIGNYQ